jgi:hypothetical protein
MKESMAGPLVYSPEGIDLRQQDDYTKERAVFGYSRSRPILAAFCHQSGSSPLKAETVSSRPVIRASAPLLNQLVRAL